MCKNSDVYNFIEIESEVYL